MKADLYNKFTKNLIRKIPKGQIVTYRLLNLQPDPYNEGRLQIPLYKGIPPTDEVYDEENDVFIPIAYIDKVLADGEAQYGEIGFERGNGGCIFLRWNNAKDQKLYQYLELSNHNDSNPYRSPAKTAWFEKIDTEADATLSRKERRVVLDALNKATNLDSGDLRHVGASLGFKLNTGEQELRDNVEDFAEYDPEKFLALVEQQTNRVEANVREAVDRKIIKHNKSSAKFVWEDTNKVIFSYKKKIGVKPFTECADYLQTKDKDQLDALQNRLEAERNNP